MRRYPILPQFLRDLRLFLCLMPVVFSICGCGSKPVATDLSQREAHEIISLLQDSGIDSTADRDRGGKAKFTVSVSAAEYLKSIKILHEHNLPAEHTVSFNDLIGESGLLPASRDVESMRIDRAMAMEVEELLGAMPGVASSAVVVRAKSAEQGSVPSIAVVVQKRGAEVVDQEKIKELVGRAMPNIAPDNISITIEQTKNDGIPRASETKQNLVRLLGFFSIPEDQYQGIVLCLLGVLVVVGITAGIMGYFFGQYQMARSEFVNPGLDGVTRAARLDRPQPQHEEGEI